jgi:hypothetical protein
VADCGEYHQAAGAVAQSAPPGLTPPYFQGSQAQWSLAGFCLSADHSVRFPNSTTLIAGSFQAFISNFRPELFQLRRVRFVRVSFSIIRSPRHWKVLAQWGSRSEARELKAPLGRGLSLFFAIVRHGLERRSSCPPATSQTRHPVSFARVQARMRTHPAPLFHSW